MHITPGRSLGSAAHRSSGLDADSASPFAAVAFRAASRFLSEVKADRFLSSPKLPVEHAVVDCLADVLDADRFDAVDVCDRAGQADHFVVSPSGEA